MSDYVADSEKFWTATKMEQLGNMGIGRIEEIPDDLGLQMLREPIPPDQIEKLPKPLWKGAWDGERAAHCQTCHGYHVLSNAIHLDYCGHALTTNRLLDADLEWDWEPLALTEQGLPLFDKVGGLWIKLTVCGVTRLGYGDGASPKEIIGDAIRNAAMRFGVALDLWSKADLHMDRNPGDGPTQSDRRGSGKRAGDQDDRDSARTNGDQGGVPNPRRQADPPSNEEAILALGEVCDEHGYDRRAMRAMYAKWSVKHLEFADRTDIADAPGEHIYAFAAKLIEDATAEPEGAASVDSVVNEETEASQFDGRSDGNGAQRGGESAVVGTGDDPGYEVNTSDVEKKPEDMF